MTEGDTQPMETSFMKKRSKRLVPSNCTMRQRNIKPYSLYEQQLQYFVLKKDNFDNWTYNANQNAP